MTACLLPNSERESLTDRLLMSFPSGQYCLPALLRVLEIVETVEVPTACVECTARPKLFINPRFVERHAETSEKLLMLVLHELHHVILGHTRLFPRATPLDNLVFDAVINAMLCQLFPEPEYTSLFTDLYDDGDCPECFLRPAKGWRPGKRGSVPRALREPSRERLAELHAALYSEVGATYSELRKALKRELEEGDVELDRLLGDHTAEGDGSSSDGRIEQRTPALFEELRRIVERWPRPPQPIAGRSLHEMLDETAVAVPPPSNRSRLERLLRKIGKDGRGQVSRRIDRCSTTVTTAVPRQDRRATVLGALGGRTFFYHHELDTRRLTPTGEKVHVYLDVSGSIGDLVAPLYAAVLTCQRFVNPVVHLFSTKIADVTLEQLRRGECRTTGGTSIDCVADHIRTNRVRRAVVITDGYVGRPGGIDAETLRSTKLGVALTPGYAHLGDLQEFVDEWIELKEIES